MAVTKRVILVAGHGNGDPGAVGQGTQEYLEAIQIVDRTYAYLKDKIETIVVPHSLGLNDSVTWVNARYKGENDAIVIEVHKNSHTAPAHGIETWIPSKISATLVDAATKVNTEIVAQTGLPNRGIKVNLWKLITNVAPLAMLVEAGFVNTGGDPVSDEYDDKYARGIAYGILKYFGISTTPPVVTPPVVVPPVVVPPAPSITYSTEGMPKMVIVKAGSKLWNFNFTKWADAKEVTNYPTDMQFEAVAVATNALKSKYYMAAYSYNNGNIRSTFGVNVNDCNEYVPPVTPPVVVPPVTDHETTQDARLSALESALAALKILVEKIMSWLTSWRG